MDLDTFIQFYSSNFLHGYIYIVLFFELLAWLHVYSFILRTACIVTNTITLFESYMDLLTFISVLFFELLAWLHLHSYILRTSCLVTYMITLFESYIDLVTLIQFYSSNYLRGSIYIVLFFETSRMVTYMITLFESYMDLVTFIQFYSSNLLHGYIYIVLFFELLAWLRLYSFLPRSSCIVTYMITVFKSYIDLDTFIQFYSSNFLHGYIYIVLFFQMSCMATNT